MTLASCRDCGNIEDRRDIDGVFLCANNIGPYVCCDEFEPRDEDLSENRLYNRFCLECTNFVGVDGTPICAKNHRPGIACDTFIDRFEDLNGTRQNNQMQTVLIAYAIKHSNPEPIPEWMVEVGHKIKW
ncbi:MAG: hypothetical protein ACXABY_34590 [Candidatus Thorarchaeota archaeon]|jgi:hypothetical protein